MLRKDIVIVEGARTPFAEFCGSFRDITAIDLGAIAAKGAIEKANVDPEEIDQVVFGNVQQSSVNAHILARHVALKANLPIHVPAVTVNRLCGTGVEAIIQAARLIMTGEAKMTLAGGTENMSQTPHVIRGMRWGSPLGGPVIEDWVWDGLYDAVGDCTMADTAENLAIKYELSREEIDRHALFYFVRHQ